MADPTKASAPILSQGQEQRKDAFVDLAELEAFDTGEACEVCGGSGETWAFDLDEPGPRFSVLVPCPYCARPKERKPS